MFFVKFSDLRFKSEVSIPDKGIEVVRAREDNASQRVFFVIGFFPRKEPIRPRGEVAITSRMRKEDEFSFRIAHIASRQGRLGPRGAKKPRYKDVHRGGELRRKHGNRGQVYDLPQDEVA